MDYTDYQYVHKIFEPLKEACQIVNIKPNDSFNLKRAPSWFITYANLAIYRRQMKNALELVESRQQFLQILMNEQIQQHPRMPIFYHKVLALPIPKEKISISKLRTISRDYFVLS